MKKYEEYIACIKNKKILIQGLGLNGGGVESSLFFLKNGINVVITDLKTREDLVKSVNILKPYEKKIRYVLGEHREKDFKEADIIVKGPGVPLDNKYIKAGINNGALITTDIEIFKNITDCKLYAVTGSKGKSSTVSVIYNIFKQKTGNSFLGGNITISPLSFYDKINKESLVVLELSSWQLRDIKDKKIKFDGCAVTNLLRDHQNYYNNMIDYLNDKKVICQNQTVNDFCIIPYDDKYLNEKSINTKARVYYYSKDNNKADIFYEKKCAFVNDNKVLKKIFDEYDLNIAGDHMKQNILIAGAFCYFTGIEIEFIKKGICSFKGVPFRMELVRIWKGIKFYNDTTATIPDASYNAINSFNDPIIWIAGGNDKNLDFSIIKGVYHKPKKIFLLTGNGTDKMKKYIKRDDIVESDSLEFLLNEAVKFADKGDVILFSPACTSFGLFQNEFHRGEVFNNLVKSFK